MAWTKKATAFELMSIAESWVWQTVTNYRNTGLACPEAFQQASLDLGISPRQVRAFWKREANSISHEQWWELGRRYVAHLEADAAWHAEQAEKRATLARRVNQERSELAAMRKATG